MTPEAVGDTTGATRRMGGVVVKVELSAHGIGPVEPRGVQQPGAVETSRGGQVR